MIDALRKRAVLCLAVCTLVLALGLPAAVSQGDYVQSGKLLVSFEAGLQPTALPRDRLVPIRAGFRGTFENLDATDTPALKKLVIQLSRGGVINRGGLPRCTPARLRGVSTARALALCRDALVGEGAVRTALRFPDGHRQRSQAKLLLFNGSGEILMHIYATKPLRGAFVVPMKIRRGSGGFPTVLEARFPEIAAGFGYLTGFQMVIDRRYRSAGRRQSYLLASCPAPKGLSRVDFELARVTYSFVDGNTLVASAIRTCKALD